MAPRVEAQGATEVVGTGMLWLSPGVPRSVAPSGIPALAVDVPIDAAPLASEPVVPDAVVDVLLELVELHPVEAVIPPPSKDELELVAGHGMVSGLMPDGVSSVAPRGMLPVDALDGDGSEAVVPSGEVAPMPEEVELVCA